MRPKLLSIRPAWIKGLVLLILATMGITGGWYLASDPWSTSPSEKATLVRQFPLSAADIRDALETPEVATDSTGRVYLVFASQSASNVRTLFFASSKNGVAGLEAPREIAKTEIYKAVSQMKGKTVTRELRMVPHVATHGNDLILAWTEILADQSGVRMMVASSADGGKNITAPRAVHQSERARPTFTAMSLAPNGSLLCSWLDNRQQMQQAYSSLGDLKTLTFQPEVLVHAGDAKRGVCPCCPTWSLLLPDGTRFVAFRDNHEGYRDIKIARCRAGETTFESPTSIVPPTWEFNGCPHDGPSLAAVNGKLHVTWMDAHTGSPRCYHACASLENLEFKAQPLHDLPIGTQGNAKLHVDSKGRLHAVWEESLEPEAKSEKKHSHEPMAPTGKTGGRAIMHAYIAPHDGAISHVQPLFAREGAYQTRPTLTSLPNGDLVASWNEWNDQGKSVVVVQTPGDRQETR